jgi:hypothetical protein
VGPEDPPQPGLGQRLPGGRAAQHHEALRRPARRRPFLAQVSGQFGEERPVHRDDPLLAALPGDPDPAQPHIHISQPQRPDLRSTQPAQQHHQRDRPVPESPQVRHERRDILWFQRLGQPLRLAHQPAAAARPARADMTQQAAAARPQPGRPPRGRHRVLRPRPRHHGELEQAAYRGDPPVHRRRRRPAPGTQPDHRLARGAHRALLPVQVVEQVHRHDVTEPGVPPGQEPQEVQQVIGVSPDRGRRERPRPQMRQEPVDQLTIRAAPLDPVTIADQHHTLPHQPSPGTPDLSVTPPAPRRGMSGSPGVSPGQGPVNGEAV